MALDNFVQSLPRGYSFSVYRTSHSMVGEILRGGVVMAEASGGTLDDLCQILAEQLRLREAAQWNG